MPAYRTGSRDYLKRAKALRAAENIDALLYAALEIRCGIEARLHEYLDGAAKVATVKKGHWQIRLLAREVEGVFDIYSKPVQIIFTHPETNEEVKIEYTPVTAELRKIGEKLGDFLHYTADHKLASKAFINRLTSLIDEGIKGLEFSTRGSLLGPPRGSGPGNKQMSFIFEEGCMPSFFKIGAQANCKMKFILVRKDEKWAYLKPA